MKTSTLRLLATAVAWLSLLGCQAVVRGGKLSDRPDDGRGIYLSTGGSPRPFRTLGFIQITGEGRMYAGTLDVGDASLDGVVRGALAAEASRMGGHGVINIEFLDENPPTGFERVSDAVSTTLNLASGEVQVEERRRTVMVTGEVIQFLDT
jgi:hypothetical protein